MFSPPGEYVATNLVVLPLRNLAGARVTASAIETTLRNAFGSAVTIKGGSTAASYAEARVSATFSGVTVPMSISGSVQ